MKRHSGQAMSSASLTPFSYTHAALSVGHGVWQVYRCVSSLWARLQLDFAGKIGDPRFDGRGPHQTVFVNPKTSCGSSLACFAPGGAKDEHVLFRLEVVVHDTAPELHQCQVVAMTITQHHLSGRFSGASSRRLGLPDLGEYPRDVDAERRL